MKRARGKRGFEPPLEYMSFGMHHLSRVTLDKFTKILSQGLSGLICKMGIKIV